MFEDEYEYPRKGGRWQDFLGRLPSWAVEDKWGQLWLRERVTILGMILGCFAVVGVVLAIVTSLGGFDYTPDVKGYHRALYRVEGACGHKAAHYWHQTYNVEDDFDGAAEDWVKRCLTQ